MTDIREFNGCDEILPSDPEYTEKRDFILAFSEAKLGPGHLLRTRADRSYSSKLGNETKNGPGPRKSGLTWNHSESQAGPKNNPRKVRPRRERELGDAANVDFIT
jgi:hypothetical protein